MNAERPISKYWRTERLPHEFCPGCGIGQVYRYIIEAISELNLDPKKVVFISGIGCTSRGVGHVRFDSANTLHGRTLAFATGVKMANPSLTVIVATGDGDFAGIGGNHLLHAARRNIDLTVVVADNMVYGSTGGQFSPTTLFDDVTPTSPQGNIEHPLDLVKIVSAAGGTYVARWTTVHFRETINSIKKGIQKKGFAFIDVLSQCPVHFGKNSLGDDRPTAIIQWFRNNSVRKEIATKTNPENLKGKIIVGEFVDTESVEFSEQYDLLLRRIRP